MSSICWLSATAATMYEPPPFRWRQTFQNLRPATRRSVPASMVTSHSHITLFPCHTRCPCPCGCGFCHSRRGRRDHRRLEHVRVPALPVCVGWGPQLRTHSFNFRCIAVEEMRRRRYSHLLLANNDIIIPPLAVPILLQQLKTSYDLVVPISSRHGSGFGSEMCCVCPSGIVSARSWAVAAAEVPLCAAAIQHRLFGAHSSQLESAYSSVWVDSDSGIGPFAAPIS
jgi:hypothetical protein